MDNKCHTQVCYGTLTWDVILCLLFIRQTDGSTAGTDNQMSKCINISTPLLRTKLWYKVRFLPRGLFACATFTKSSRVLEVWLCIGSFQFDIKTSLFRFEKVFTTSVTNVVLHKWLMVEGLNHVSTKYVFFHLITTQLLGDRCVSELFSLWVLYSTQLCCYGEKTVEATWMSCEMLQ